MSGSKVLQVMRFAGITALLMAVGCSPQNIPIDESSPYFNAGRPHATYLQSGTVTYGSSEKHNYGVVRPPQFIARPNVAQKETDDKKPEYVGHFVPILQQSLEISPDGSYTFRAYSNQFVNGTQSQESGGLRYPAVQDEPSRFIGLPINID